MTAPADSAAAVAPAMREWVSSAIAQLVGELTFERIGGGRSNLTYLVIGAEGGRVVLRRPPLGQLLPSAHDMVREHRILSALQGSAVPVPEILGFCDDPGVSEHPFFVMSHVEGVVVDSDTAAVGLGDGARAVVGPHLARTLADLHGVDIDHVGLGDLGRRDGYAARQIRRWTRQWELTKLAPLPVVDHLAHVLSASIPADPPRPVLVHGDYNLANVIVEKSGGIAAVLDWELCTLGHPLADLGTLITYWPDRPEEATLERDPVPLLEGFASRAELIRAYGEARPDVDLEVLPYWIALASWKLAIILQGVYRRWLENPANGGRSPGSMQEAVRRLAGLAVDALEHRAGATARR